MAVEIEWIDSISPQATGNKIYRDTVPSTGEVEIADIAKGVQFYSDGTVAEGTEYKYEVQAHDGAGDETTQEVEGDNMDFITTAGSSVLEIYEQDNAASIDTEVNSIGNWGSETSPSFATNTSVDSGTTTPYNGSYCLEVYYNGVGSYVFSQYGFLVTSGKTYNISLYAKQGVGTVNAQNIRITDVDGLDSTQNVSTSSWAEYTWSLTATATGTGLIKVLTGKGTVEEASVFIDAISIEEV